MLGLEVADDGNGGAQAQLDCATTRLSTAGPDQADFQIR